MSLVELDLQAGDGEQGDAQGAQAEQMPDGAAERLPRDLAAVGGHVPLVADDGRH